MSLDQLAGLNVIDFATLSAVSTGVTSLADGTPPLVNGKIGGKTVRRIFLTCETGNLRYRTDGTDAVDAAGSSHMLAKDGSLSWTGANYKQVLPNLRFIGAGSTVPVSITYFD